MQSVLTPQFLSEQYTKVASLSLQNPMLDFYSKPQNYDGDEIEFAVFDDDREAAPINPRGAPARTLDARSATKKKFVPIHAFNEIVIPQASVEYLRQADNPMIQDRGLQEIQRQMELFGRRHRALRSVVLSKALAGGIVYFSGDGQVLESSSGATLTVDLGVGSTHKTQLAHASNGGSDIIGTAWDNAAASILTDLEQIRAAAEYDKVATPRHVWMHGSAKSWILSNTEIKAFVQYQNPQAANFLNVLGGGGDTLVIGDWTFHFYNGTYIGADGSTVRPLIPITGAIITPDVNDGTWFRQYETSETIPTMEGIVSGYDQLPSMTTKVFGDFAYLKLIDNPVKTVMRMGMNFFYGFADANAVWFPTVDF